MFSEDVFPRVRSKSTAGALSLLGLFLAGKVFRSSALIHARELATASTAHFLFFTLFFSSIVFFAIQHFSSSSSSSSSNNDKNKKPFTSAQLWRIFIHSCLLLSCFFLWTRGLQSLGAVKSVLLDYSEYSAFVLVGTSLGWRRMRGSRVPIIACVCISIILLLMATQYPPQLPHHHLNTPTNKHHIDIATAPDTPNSEIHHGGGPIRHLMSVEFAEEGHSEQEPSLSEDLSEQNIEMAVIPDEPAPQQEQEQQQPQEFEPQEAPMEQEQELREEQVVQKQQEEQQQPQQPQQEGHDHHSGDVDLALLSHERLNDLSSLSLIICSIVLSLLRKNYSRGLSAEIGGSKRLYALSLPIATCLLLPFLFFASLDTTSSVTPSSVSMEALFLYALIGCALIVAPFFTDLAIQSHPSDTSLLPTLGLTTSFIVAAFAQYLLDASLPPFSLIASLLFMALAVRLSIKERNASAAASGSGLMVLPTSSSSVEPTKTVVFESYHNSSQSDSFSISSYIQFIWQNKDSRKIASFLCVNFAFMFVEVVYGWWTNSLGLISDAAHMMFDCSALAIGLYASFMAKWRPNQVYTYGYGRYEVLCGFVNGLFLIFIAVFVFIESLERLFDPPDVHTDRLMLVSVGGLVVNMIGVFFFHSGHDHSNHNMRGVFLHILADTLGSCGVIASSFFIEQWGWMWSDPLCSLCISIMILISSGPLISDSAYCLLQRTPEHLERDLSEAVTTIRTKIEGVVSVYEPHFWTQNSHLVIGTLHVQVAENADDKSISQRATEILKSAGVSSVCIQLERINALDAAAAAAVASKEVFLVDSVSSARRSMMSSRS